MGANKNSIKIIGEETELRRPGLLRLRLEEIRFGDHFAPALWPQTDPRALPDQQRDANFRRLPPVHLPRAPRHAALRQARRRLPAQQPYGPDEVWDHLPLRSAGATSSRRNCSSTSSTPTTWPHKTGMGGRINTIMQTCFFAISGVLPREQAIEEIKKSIKKTYGKRGDAVVQTELRSGGWHPGATCTKVKVPAEVTSNFSRRRAVAAKRPDSSRTCSARSSSSKATTCPSAPCRWTAPSPPPPRSGKNATSRLKSRSGNPTCASSAASAPLSARTPSSA